MIRPIIYDVIPWRQRDGSPKVWVVIRWQAGPCAYVRISRVTYRSERAARQAAGLAAMLDFRRTTWSQAQIAEVAA